MQIVVPMSGYGERFRRAGYTVPKPLIEVDGRPIIGHVVDLFPGAARFVFICNREHLDDPRFDMRGILKDVCPQGEIVAIEPHRLGPVHAVLAGQAAIDPALPTVINYCDFSCLWDFDHFRTFVAELECDGAIPAYTGFHPHMLGSTNYAYLRHTNGWVEDIQEKRPFTDRPMQEYASSGSYYFRTGALALDYCQRARSENLSLNGEFYVSLAYKPMLQDGRGVIVYPLQHFMQWGTPEDLAVYTRWSRTFARLAAAPATRARQAGAVMIPLAGLGSRFARETYSDPKPLIPVSGAPMVVRAARALPRPDRQIFVLREDLPLRAKIESKLSANFPDARIETIAQLTDGQARSCALALDAVDLDAPLTIGACDCGVLYDERRFEALMADPQVDVIVWASRGHPNAAAHPEMYGWIETQGDGVVSVSVKKPLANPADDPIVIGVFTFKRARDFAQAAESLFERKGAVNGEYYVDSCINDALAAGLDCRVLEVDAYLSWGTPDELRTFEYWQSCFHKWPRHPYRLEMDRHIPEKGLADLGTMCRATTPPSPGPRASARPVLPSPNMCAYDTPASRFIVVGLTTVAIDFLLYALLYALGLPTRLAKAASFAAGTLFAYFANRRFTFGAQAEPHRYIAFGLLYATTLAINVAINQTVLSLLADAPARFFFGFGLATAVSAALNFIGMKAIVFRRRRQEAAP